MQERQLFLQRAKTKQGCYSLFVFILLTAAARPYLWLPFHTEVFSAVSCRNSKAGVNRTLVPSEHVCNRFAKLQKIEKKTPDSRELSQGGRSRTQLIVLWSPREGGGEPSGSRSPPCIPNSCLGLWLLGTRGLSLNSTLLFTGCEALGKLQTFAGLLLARL